MDVPIKPRITISKTPAEWQNIECRLKEVSKKDIYAYVNNEVQRFTKKYISNPEEIHEAGGQKIHLQFTIKPSTYLILREISKKTNRPINSIIDELIIIPLLLPKP